MVLEVPVVTQDDLFNFHQAAFGHLAHGTSSPQSALCDGSHEDDGLGFYPDGNKRTLTDEQIKIFRHSEIFRLMREASQEADAAADDSGDKSDGQISDELEGASPQLVESGEVRGLQKVEEKDDDDDDDDEEEEYADFLEREKQEFQQAATRRRRQMQRQSDHMISTRRRVRELDDVRDFAQILNYDGESRDNAEEIAPSGFNGQHLAKKEFLWPLIQGK